MEGYFCHSFLCSIFLGFELISKVPATLLPCSCPVNGTCITVLGALSLLVPTIARWPPGLGRPYSLPSLTLCGYMVTDRMLAMFRKAHGRRSMNLSAELVNFAYIISAALFILGQKCWDTRLPPAGVPCLGRGMALAIIVTLLADSIVSFEVIALGPRRYGGRQPRAPCCHDLHAGDGGPQRLRWAASLLGRAALIRNPATPRRLLLFQGRSSFDPDRRRYGVRKLTPTRCRNA